MDLLQRFLGERQQFIPDASGTKVDVGAPSRSYQWISRARASSAAAEVRRMIQDEPLTDRPPSTTAAYLDHMVNPALQSAIEAMSLDERLELVEYIESTVESAPIEVSEEQKAMIRSRAAELDADPSIGLTWDELKARLDPRRA